MYNLNMNEQLVFFTTGIYKIPKWNKETSPNKKMLHSTSPVQMKTSNEAPWSNIIESLFNFQKK